MLNPITGALLFLLVVIGIAMPVMAIGRAWIVDGTMDAGVAIASLVAIFCLIGFIWNSQGTIWMFVGIATLIGGSIGLPLLGAYGEKRAKKNLLNEDIENYRRAIEFDPGNVSAHRFLGDAYMKEERYEEAIIEYQTAIRLNPKAEDASRRKLRNAYEAQEMRAQPLKKRREGLIVCDKCQAESPASTKYCPGCGEVLNMGFLEWLFQPENFKGVLKQTVISMCVLVALLAVFAQLPLEAKGCIIIATTIVGTVYWLRNSA
ncbi:MAG TPA: tetratricopeptide repeat protein [Abditibacteriaceae bacterium]|nr:tetratricopeptide repeat protein [Abditibacteriaceae bacterium]